MVASFLRRRRLVATAATAAAIAGCQWYLDTADQQVYKLIEQRQQDALDATSNARLPRPRTIEGQTDPFGASRSRYDFVPSPTDSEVPPAFDTTRRPASQPATPTTLPAVREMTLSEALAYAFRHSREYQTAKEQLYLAALRLTLERHLWEPRFFGNLGVDYTSLGKADNFDQTLRAVAEAGVRQRLPYGGEIVARTINTFVSKLTEQAIGGATGQMLLEANLPLLRGAGTAAYETRYQAERNLIYAVRTFENFRRSLATSVAGAYFELQQLRQAIDNSRRSRAAFEQDLGRARAWFQSGRLIQLDVQRAEQALLGAQNDVVDAVARYENALDLFKIQIGMPMENRIDVTYPLDVGAEVTTQPAQGSLEAAIRMPDVSEDEAIRVALKYRLDLMNDYDRIGDAERGVAVAENNILPDLRANASVRWHTDPRYRQIYNYNTDRVTYNAGVNLELPLDRVAERNALRQAFIAKAQAERDYEEARDQVTLEVRRAIRVVRQQQKSLEIQILNRDVALNRRKAYEVLQAAGGVKGIGNRDVIEAENALLSARNSLAQAQARLNLAILQFRRDTGTLRVDEDGHWAGPQEVFRPQ